MATSEEIRNWFAANPGASDAQIAAAMQANNVSSGEVASALGVDPGMVAQRYAAATAPAPTQPAAAPAPVTTPETWVPGASVGLLRSRQSGRSDADYYGSVAVAANKWLQNPGTAAEAFDAMVKSGISVNDLLNAGISQGTIDNAFMSPTSAVQKTVNATALNSMTSMLAQNPLITREIDQRGIQDIYKGARDYVAALQQGGLTDAERNKLREAATVQGWGFADIRAAGIDPTILFGAPKPVVPPPEPPTPVTPTPVTPTPVFPQPVPYTPVNVYQPLPQQPDIYAAGQPALDVAFRESAPRTAIPGMPGAYEYTPAAKLRPATGAGYSWTPPSVTSRPRSLLSPTLLSYVSPSQQFAQSRAAQDQALLGAFRQSGLPQNASNFYSWRNRLRSGEFGAGSAFDPTAFQSAFGSWAATQAPRTPARGTAPVGDVTGYSEIAGRIQPIDLRTVPTFAEGGEASARELLDRLKKPEGAGEEVPGAVDQGPRNLPLERMNARRTRAGMGPFVPQAPTGTAGQEAADMLAALSLATAPLPVASDISGLAADAAMYAAYPEERTLGNAALSVLGALPFVPAASAVRAGEKAADAIQQAPTEARQMLEEVAPAARQIDTPEFKNWFGESKVVDESGQPLRVYHGTAEDFDEFKYDPKNSMGVWFATDPNLSSQYAEIASRGGKSPLTIPAYISIKRPANKLDLMKARKVAEKEEVPNKWANLNRRVREILQDQGFDGITVDDTFIVFDPTQIKSAIGNEGTFDPTNPVITKADGGEVTAPQTESRRLLDQVEAGNQGLRNLPLERMNARRARAGMDPYAPARPAASMLENIIRGGAAIPGTVGRYAERVVGSEDPLAKLGGDITGVGGAMLQGLKEDPLGFAADVAPIIGEIRSAADVDKYSALANEAIAAGNPALAKVYQEIVAMSAAGAVPLAGMATRVGGRVGKRGLIDAAERAAKEAAEQAPTEARQMLEALAPETGQLPAEDVLSPAITRPVEPMPLTESEKMLSELDEIQADLPETVRPTITEEIGDRRRVGTTGRYVGAPEGINTPQKLAALTRSITNLTKEGAFGRFWYERSGRQILDITGGNTEDADKLVQAIAITSPNTPVGANFDYALQAYYQWKNGQPIKTGMYTTAMSDKLQRMFDGEEWAGRKTNNFYNNLMREIDPSKAQGVTTDIWMMRAFGFGKDAPTDAQYSFVENETKRIAKNLGWEPQQVQAAIWVALKSRMENPDVKRAVEEKSFENGWITYNDEGERVVLDQNKHAANWLEKAMQHTPTEADREAAKFDYADAAANNLAQISWESIPSRTSGHMPEIFEAAPEVVQDYHVQMSKAFLDDDGNDILAKEFDILSPGDFEAPGYFEQRVSPGTQTNITAPRQYGVTRRIEAIKKQAAEEGWSKEQRDAAIRAATYATDPSAREAMYAYAAARGILLKQDGVGMHRPAFITGLSRPKANGIEVSIGRPLTARETAEIARLVAAEAGHTEYNPIGSPSGVRFINFDYLGTPNLDFQKTVNNALKKMNFDNDEAVDAKMFGADTGYLSNNWKENFNGEGYLESGELARRPDLQRKVRDLVTRLAPRVSAVEEEFANRYSWNRNTNLNRSYETQQAVGTPSGTVTPAPEIPELPATVRPFKRGGSVERMINDNRKYL